METAEQGAGPVLVSVQEVPKKRRTRANISPSLENSSPKVEPAAVEAPPAPPSGNPDHSLVPRPRKKVLPADEAVRYWNSVPKQERDEWFIAYVYRDIPVCDPTLPLSLEDLRAVERGKKKKPETNCGKVTEPFDPENWQQQFRDKWGAGDYRVRLNDQHPSIRATVVEFEVKAGRDWDNHPPALELAEVVLSDPQNESYIRWAHLKGVKFPGEPGSPENPEAVNEEEEDMANVSAVVESNRHLTDRVIEMSKEASASGKTPPVTAPTDVANSRAVEVIADAATKAQKMMLDGIQAAQASQTKAQDPMEFHKAVTEAARAMQPAAASSGPTLTDIVALMQTMMAPITAQNVAMLAEVRSRAEAAERRAEAAEARANAIAHPAQAPPVEPPNQVKSALELIKGLASLRDAAAPILGDSADPTAGMPVWARLADKAMDTIPNMLHNLTVMKTGQGTPEPPGELAAELIDEEKKPALTTPELKTEDTGMISNRKIAETLAAPLIESLNRGDHGFQFAAGMILHDNILGFPGNVVYELALSKGKDGMYQILQSYPELWQKLVHIPKKFDMYLTEFLDRDTAYQIAKESRNPQPPQAAAPPVAEPIQTVTPEVLPRVNGKEAPAPKAGGRKIIGADGQAIQTAHGR